MFSIASYKDSAIAALMDMARKTSSYKAKIGVIHCIHLIGINSTLSYGEEENFVNVNARKALLDLLTEEPKKSLRDSIIYLLIRDPWQSDIPVFLNVLRVFEKDNSMLINALARYKIKDPPIRNKLPSKIAAIEITVKRLSERTSWKVQYKEALAVIGAKGNGMIEVEPSLYTATIDPQINLIVYTTSKDYHLKKKVIVTTVGFVVELLTTVDFMTLGSNVHYYVENGKLYLCSKQEQGRGC